MQGSAMMNPNPQLLAQHMQFHAHQLRLVALCRKHNAPVKEAWELERLEKLAEQIQRQEELVASLEQKLERHTEAGQSAKLKVDRMNLGKEKIHLELLRKYSTNQSFQPGKRPSWATWCTPVSDEVVMGWFRHGYDPDTWAGVESWLPQS